jgi:hypothetical protein
MRTWTALYGAERLVRAICPECHHTALVEDGRTACCRAEVAEVEGIRREAEATRWRVSARIRRRILQEQDWRCLYCARRFGSSVRRHGRTVRLRYEFDHMVPNAFAMDGRELNIAAACHVCNRLKRNLCFASLEEARAVLHVNWGTYGYTDSPSHIARGYLSALPRSHETDTAVATVLLCALPLADLGPCSPATEAQRSTFRGRGAMTTPPSKTEGKTRRRRAHKALQGGCIHCGMPLKLGRRDRRYCDSTCRVYALRQRRAAMKKA